MSADGAGRLLQNEPMARHTSWRVGGPARQWFEPASRDDLAAFLARLPDDEPLLWVGLGSNLLVRDGGFAGTVIFCSRGLGQIEQHSDGGIHVGAGATCAKVARFCTRLGLAGAEFLAGIPGSMGGALAMNAGAFGGETWQIVEQAETIDRAGHVRRRPVSDFDVGYRHVQGADNEWFTGACLRLHSNANGIDDDHGAGQIRALLDRRNRTQPIGQASCGSVFRNPPGDHAARLIEACGLKGKRIGGAEVSTQHANFIINTGAATAADIEDLIALVAVEVERQQGVRLLPEVRIVGSREAKTR